MDVLDRFFAFDALHALSQGLLIPTVVCLVLLVAYAVYTLGSLVVEVFVERRHYRVALPQMIAEIDAASYEDLDEVVARSGLLDTQRGRLQELISYLYLPEDARTEVAKRLLADEDIVYQKTIGRTMLMSKVAPMFGLMCTLIPLGPGIVALGAGDTETLSSSLLVAFDGTVAGLVVAIVCLAVSTLRRRWYDDYLVSMESAFNTLLEKAGAMHDRGYDFGAKPDPRPVCGQGAKRVRDGRVDVTVSDGPCGEGGR